MRRRITVVLAALVVVVTAGAPTTADASPRWLKDRYSAHWWACYHEKGCDPGRNIRKWGVKTKHGSRQARDRDYHTSLAQIHRLRHPYLVPVAPAQRPAGIPSAGPNGTLQAIAACESSGNPAAVSRDGLYRGKYQFDRQTWRSMGGSGDPAAAPEAEQDYRAAQLLASRGRAPWPNC